MNNRRPFAERLADLAETFPTLKNADGLRPFDADRLRRWGATQGSGAGHAVAFVAHVYNYANPFELARAMGVWDAEHRAAFAAWAADPFIH